MAIERNVVSEKDATAVEAPIHGNILDIILTHVPLIHLLPASQVSRSWNSTVSTSLRGFNKPKPWLILHTQNTRSPYPTTAHTFDLRSRVWVQIHKPEIKYVSVLRSAHSSLLYMLSPTKFSFSFDPLHQTWEHVAAPIMWRTNPIVGKWVVIADGTYDFEDDPLAVEMYDVELRTWCTCESMPSIFKDKGANQDDRGYEGFPTRWINLEDHCEGQGVVPDAKYHAMINEFVLDQSILKIQGLTLQIHRMRCR